MYKYEMDPTRTVGATEPTWDAGWMDGQLNGQTEWNQYTPHNFVVRGYKNVIILMKFLWLAALEIVNFLYSQNPPKNQNDIF